MTLFSSKEFNAEKLHYAGILVCDLQVFQVFDVLPGTLSSERSRRTFAKCICTSTALSVTKKS
jgi:hypothetical protein